MSARTAARFALPRLRPLAFAAAALAVRRQRRALAELDDHRLDDLGLTREEARTEAERPIWDVPAHWTR